MPTSQNYANHKRIHGLYHFALSLVTLLVFIGSLIYLGKALADGEHVWNALLFTGTSLCLIILFLIVRGYAAKVQDRAIRAEEQLRHFMLTGKPLDSRLSLKQIIALRFAGDDEFPPLAEKAAQEQMAPSSIKQAVRNWRADHHRV
ncbi:MAG: hypothetical protein K0R67_1364 [Paenibacillus sp.]|nr:hypothetical protein [Paenibacillus sp.]